MRDVCLGHDQAIVADLRQHAATGGAAMNRDELAYVVARADPCFGWFAFVLQILRSEANRNEWEYMRARANGSSSVDNAMRFETYAVAELHFITDDAVWTNKTVVPDLGAGAYYGCRMDACRVSGCRHKENKSIGPTRPILPSVRRYS